MHCGHHGESGPHAGADVGDSDSHFLRVAVRIAGEAHQSADSLHDLVVRRKPVVRPVLAEPGNGSVDDPRVYRLHRIVAQPEALHDTRGEVFHNDIGILGQLEENFLGLIFLEVESQASLVTVYGQEVCAFAFDEGRPPLAGVVAASGDLDLDHIGPVVAQHQRAERACQRPGQIEHFQPFQCFHSRQTPWSRLMGITRARGYRGGHAPGINYGVEILPESYHRPRVIHSRDA